MQNLGIILTIFITFLSLGSFAEQSGYILNGKVVVTHRDGIPVDNNESEKPRSNARKSDGDGLGRSPAGLVKMQGILQFDEDDLARCYWLPKQETLQCIKK